MQAILTILGLSALLAGVGGYIWYKIRSGADLTKIADAVSKQKDEAVAGLQAQVELKSAQERKELHEDVVKVLAIEDSKAKQAAALELLTRIRRVD